MIVLGRNLKTKFDLIFNEYASSENELSIDAVVIENQIGPLAGRMKMLQGMIAQYFIMKNALWEGNLIGDTWGACIFLMKKMELIQL